ncbi:MAG: hypothetical protein CFE47_29070 [Pseudomonas sp. PGPPP1]|uniref:DUF2513 domain-containing protein n=1 Tax=Pseudomonas sp. PGPPP1 TaxID=2015553 RepID=UPI000BC9DC8C|nr:DUF2513 domain-containing protein [Pseudomonas sp. PGPPP1]OYU03990.1 MAG: hypothetical protein CFE47_29070 [Pseudomonas sp. PGPPP1]
MKRDLDLVRKILIYYEEKDFDGMDRTIEIDGYSESLINYHLLLMDEAGLLRCERSTSSKTPDRVIKVYPFSLTWSGHEFLSAARNEGLWGKAKSLSLDKAGVLSFDIMKDLLISLAKEKLGIS